MAEKKSKLVAGLKAEHEDIVRYMRKAGVLRAEFNQV